MQVEAAGFQLERRERCKRGIVKRLVARKPQADQANPTAVPTTDLDADADADAE
ncbi:hypothetical protein FRACA_10110 [Frankia canadensis]|uniref:Uncharacterized protein n=1 Tax=Frankia canadensis TaxID=1836972 RepID=A0A2I2KI56_9ACTN|nr:hypothetical protein [Frankia canadensis]SNQ45351.1 hypothetical protein FRACA_10110 [Frankia canadensis]SOU52641.1 hypothetical protein FRACA_10110 [Frankia canadensis]